VKDRSKTQKITLIRQEENKLSFSPKDKKKRDDCNGTSTTAGGKEKKRETATAISRKKGAGKTKKGKPGKSERTMPRGKKGAGSTGSHHQKEGEGQCFLKSTEDNTISFKKGVPVDVWRKDRRVGKPKALRSLMGEGKKEKNRHSQPRKRRRRTALKRLLCGFPCSRRRDLSVWKKKKRKGIKYYEKKTSR